jgi:signal transduction protein with GAF and PtsI domain
MDIKTVVEILVLILGAGVGWGVFTTKIESLKQVFEDQKKDSEKEHQNLWKVIGQLRVDFGVHEKDSATVRLDLEKEMGRLRENSGITTSKLDSIISLVTDLTKRFDRMEERRE